ncbi:MAG TPA: YIP1 family protein [Gemmatimonadaceae bacterium]|nr:YIP1 family protein [Gemmatimonadaceae bacterium]
MTDSVISPTPPKATLWEDFIDIFYQPVDVFERRREGQFGAALLVLAVLSGALYLALQNGLAPIFDAEASRAAAAMAASNPELNSEQLAAGQGVMEKFGVLFFVLGTPLGVAVSALVLWLVGKLFDAKQSFAATMMVATYANFPRLLELVINAVQGLMMSPESVSSRFSVSLGPARFLDPDATNPVLLAVLGSLDFFTIWVTVLLGVGLYVTGLVTKRSAAIAAGVVWLVSLIPSLYGTLQGA